MKKLKETLSNKGIGSGYLYFYVHLITELVCFFMLARQIGDSPFLWTFPLIYDSLSFVPQSLFGYLSDKYPKIKMGIIGTFLLALAVLIFSTNLLPGKYTAIVILCIGNALIHINGAEVTLRSSGGKLAPSAIFVAGGSFGVIIGKLLGKTLISYWLIILLALTMIPFILLAEYYRNEADEKSINPCTKFNYHSLKIKPGTIVILAILIILVRGYMGYGIPTTWKKTTIQAVILYFSMGIGKALGGILADTIGFKKTALISAGLALPFLLFGDNLMLVSLIGVMFFSMTMAITLGLLVSVLKHTPGLAFGLTTIGLFLGTLPIFFFKLTTTFANSVVITILTILCLIVMSFIIRKDEKIDG